MSIRTAFYSEFFHRLFVLRVSIDFIKITWSILIIDKQSFEVHHSIYVSSLIVTSSNDIRIIWFPKHFASFWSVQQYRDSFSYLDVIDEPRQCLRRIGWWSDASQIYQIVPHVSRFTSFDREAFFGQNCHQRGRESINWQLFAGKTLHCPLFLGVSAFTANFD